MKKNIAIFVTLAVLGAFKGGALADDISNNFQTVLSLNQDKPLDALAQDLGSILGGGSFRSGKALGFPLGFDVGANIVVAGVQKDNLTLKDDGSTTENVFGQAEIGLPMKLNAIIRVGKALGGDMLGGGLSYGIFKPSIPGLPALLISALYDQLKHDDLDAKTYSANAVLSIDLPIIDPFVGVGYDNTTVKPTTEAYRGLPAGVNRNQKGTSDGYRAEAGVNLHFIPFTYITLGVGVANGQEMYHGGAGIRF